MEISNCEKRALDFLQKRGIDFKAEFIEHGKHFEGDKEARDIYNLQLKRLNHSISFRFGQSIAHSRPSQRGLDAAAKVSRNKRRDLLSRVKEPTAYDLLATITKDSPGLFANFCRDFGYDEDSIIAKKIYKGVCEEWFKVASFFTAEELEELREIN